MRINEAFMRIHGGEAGLELLRLIVSTILHAVAKDRVDRDPEVIAWRAEQKRLHEARCAEEADEKRERPDNATMYQSYLEDRAERDESLDEREPEPRYPLRAAWL